jgi:hypothetical protein
MQLLPGGSVDRLRRFAYGQPLVDPRIGDFIDRNL